MSLEVYIKSSFWRLPFICHLDLVEETSKEDQTSKEDKKTPLNMNPPGYNYLGPGNPLDNGDPTNDLDAIARDHDYSYANAKDNVDILESDLEYSGRMMLNSITSFNPMEKMWSIIGSVGLGLKAIEEAPFTLTGTTNPLAYPGNLPNIATQDTFQKTIGKLSPTVGQVSALGTKLLNQIGGNQYSQGQLDAMYTGLFAIGQIIDL